MTRAVFVLGPPASGKSTLAQALGRSYGWAVISIGELLREHAEVDLEVHDVLASGSFVSDELVFDLISQALAKLDTSQQFVLFDGLPRTLEQVEWLASRELLTPGSVVVVLSAKPDTLLARLRGRAKRAARTDDDESAFRRRLLIWSDNADSLARRLDQLTNVIAVDTETAGWNDALANQLSPMHDQRLRR